MPEMNTQSQPGNIPPYPPPYYPAPKKRRWWIPVLIIALLFFFIVLPILAVIGLVGSAFEEEEVVVKNNTVLVVNLGRQIQEYSKDNPFAQFFGNQSSASYNEILYAIKRAKKDDRIEGIYLKTSPNTMGFAKTLELIEVLNNFKQSGKFVYSFINMGGESSYMAALPSDKIFVPEEGFIELNGFGIEAMFMTGLLKKLGIEFYVEHFEDFKSAGETLSRRKFSDSARLEYRQLIQQRHRLFVDAVAKYRKLKPEAVNSVLARGVYSTDSLLALGFVDSLMNQTDFSDMLKELTTESNDSKKKNKKLQTVSVASYLKADYDYDKRKYIKDKRIAVIYAVGPIVETQDNKFSDEYQITKKIAKYIKKARENDKIKAIILRVDSPGGSVLVSDEIWKEVVKTKGVKPIYASMSDVAASGGYYISMACDTIIAHPATITGSIGVIAALPNLSGTWEKLDITLDTISTSPAAHDLSLNFPFRQEQKDKLHNMIEKIYFRFVKKVAEGRNMTFDQARALAKGRVWTGEQAKENKLVDVLGGITDAIKIAKHRIGVSDNEKVMIVEYPKHEDPFETLIKMFMGHEDEDEVSFTKTFEQKLSTATSSYAELYKTMPYSLQLQVDYARSLMLMARNEHFMFALPYYITVE